MTAGFEVPARADGAVDTPGNTFRQDPFILESRGWSSHSIECAPKLAALASLVNLGATDPVASVSYRSQGNLLVIAGGSIDRARRSAHELAADLHVTLIANEFAAAPAVTSWRGEVRSLTGFLGEFRAEVALDAAAAATPAKFDLILDFSTPPLFDMRQPPQGYHAAPGDEGSLARVLDELRESVGEFEKPRYFAYRESICAHSRSEITGCNACIEICSTKAIAPDGDHVKVDPHLCMGCGACATVCPSGAMSYQYPRVADRGAQMKQLLSTYRHAGGTNPCVVFHDGDSGRALLSAAAASSEGLPARALPLETWHVASIGLDLLLPAIAFGASQVVVLASRDADREYVAALREQMAIGQTILAGLGYTGAHFALVEADDAASLESAFRSIVPARTPDTPATFMLGNDKRTAIEFAVEHLARHAPAPVDEIALPAGAPYGEVLVDRDKCTMCMACVGSCPESALMDGVDQPLLKFLERNCVQCGLCESTCPEGAIALSPRLLLTPAVREARVVNQTEPFHCVSCGKAFGTRQIVQSMLGRLAGHSMFAGEGALRRLQMCGDCRVVDMMSSKNEVSVLKLGSDS
ncbi:MAG: 4Fe-4S binding protein [Burkholderiales bacterium]|nr:4Fe-4S binding protein [Burkholderiales bacterium]